MSRSRLLWPVFLLCLTVSFGCTSESESTNCDADSAETRCDWDFDDDAGHDADDKEVGEDTTVEDVGQDTDEEEVVPVSGVINGQDFEFVSGAVNHVDNTHYVVGLRNYEVDCDGTFDIPEGVTPLIVNFEIIDTEPGTDDISFGSGHGASLQYELDSEERENFTVEEGTLTLQEWTTTTGEKISGELVFSAEDGEHSVSGSFEAEICF